MNSKDLIPVKILIADDSPGDIRLVKEALRDSRIINQLYTVQDGMSAIDFLRKTNGFESMPTPDLILLDLNMPRKNGFEVLAEIKQDPLLKAIPIVVMTVSNNEKDILESYNLYANCYITKPVDFEQFVSIVRSIENFWFSIVSLPKNSDRDL